MIEAPVAWASIPLSFLSDLSALLFGPRLRRPTCGTWGAATQPCAESLTGSPWTSSAPSHSPADFYTSAAWRVIRYKALLRSSGRCQCCGSRPTPTAALHVDHIKPRSRYPHLALSLDNLQVLCSHCNLGKLAWDETDWRGR